MLIPGALPFAVLAALVLGVRVGMASAQTLAPLPDLGLMEPRGSVRAIAVQPDGKVVIGGDFTMVNGVPRNHLARLNADGTLDAAWNPDPDVEVYALAVAGTTVYAAGFFGRIGGQPRRFLAALDGTTGAATAWNPDPDKLVLAIAAAGSVVYAGGDFDAIGGATRRKIAALDAATGNATAWNPNATLASSNLAVQTIAVDGNTVYAGGDFTIIGGQSRNKLAALDAASGAATPWNPSPTGPSDVGVDQIAVLAGTVYVAGAFTSIGGQARHRLAAIDAATGNATGWNPNPAPANAFVFALAAGGSTVYTGGTFTTIGGAARSFLAALDATTGNATAWNPSPNNEVRALAASGGTVHVGGSFHSIAGEVSLMFARLDATTGLHVAGFRPAAGIGSGVSKLARQSDAKIVAAGAFRWAGKAGVARSFLLRLNADGTLDVGWDPAPNGVVRALATAGTITYVGGGFTTIAGVTRNRLAALDGATGNATAWHPDADQSVGALALDGNTLYAGGEFTTIGGASRRGLVALDATTGGATAWTPNVDGTASALALSDGTIYASGIFTGAGILRIGLAALDAVTGEVTAWNPSPNGVVNDIEVAGGTVLVGGTFTSVGGSPRNRIAALDAVTGAALPWNPDADADVADLARDGGTVYAGGGFTSIGGQARSAAAALDAASGGATTWDADLISGSFFRQLSVLAQLVAGGSVHTGGFFTSVLGEERTALAALSLSAGDGLPVGFSPAVLHLGEAEVGTSGAGHSIRLTNFGATALAIASIVASGDYTQTNECGPTLASGASCAVEVTFAPTVVGPRLGAITVTSDAPGSPHAASLTGLATQPGQFCCDLSVEGCVVTVSRSTSYVPFVHRTRVDLPPPTPTATGPSVLIGEFPQGSATSLTRTVAVGPASILVGEDMAQVCFVPAGFVHVNEHTFDSIFISELFQPTEVPPLDHFTCYKSKPAKAPKGVASYPKFAPTTATLVDRFGTTEANDQHALDLKKPLVVCNPTDPNGEDPTAPTHAPHLEGYSVKITKTAPKQPKPVTSVRSIENRLGPLKLTIKAPDRVLVPSAKALGDGGATPLASTGVDHYKCYRAKVAKAKKGQGPFPVFTRTSVTLTDQFGGPLQFDLKKPTRLCAPADKNGENPGAPSHVDHLVCYQAKLTKQAPKQPKFVAQTVSTANQFGAEVLRAKSIEELCVPSTATD